VAHYAEPFARRVTEILHDVLPSTRFYKTVILVVPDLATGIFITYDGVQDDSLHVQDCSWERWKGCFTWVACIGT
jgi:hypothetical protein